MELLIRECPCIAGLAFPDKRSFVASPGRDVPVQTVVRNIQLATTKPLRMRRVPLQNRVPLLKPVELLSHPGPETFRVRVCLSTQLVQFGHRFDMRLLGKWFRRREEALLLLEGFDVSGDCRHRPCSLESFCSLVASALNFGSNCSMI